MKFKPQINEDNKKVALDGLQKIFSHFKDKGFVEYGPTKKLMALDINVRCMKKDKHRILFQERSAKFQIGPAPHWSTKRTYSYLKAGQSK